MKKSLLITLEFPPQKGGVANFYYNICNNLPADQIAVLTKDDQNSSYFDNNQNFKIIRTNFFNQLTKPRKIVGWSTLKILLWQDQLASIIKKEGIELLQVGNLLPLGTLALALKKRISLPYVIYLHGLDISLASRNWRQKKLAKNILDNCTAIIANSSFTKKIVVDIGIDPSKISVVSPGPNIIQKNLGTDYIEKIKKEYDLSSRPIILSVGRLVQRKGFDRVIEAMPSILKLLPKTIYLIVGNGPDLLRLKTIAYKKNLGENVLFIHNTSNEELEAFYRLCDIFAMPARQIGPDFEGFGIVYLEANLFGKPVLGGKSGGVPEAVLDGETGLLADPENSNEVARKIIKLLTDRSLSEKLGLQGANRVLHEFTWPNIVKKIQVLLD